MSPHTKNHHYSTTVRWTGNKGAGTGDYRAYERSHEIVVEGKPTIAGSSDPAFRGDAAKHNPEELLVASLSACHMLWYLHLCADAGVVVTDYIDQASGIMSEGDTGVGRFTVVTLKPRVSITEESHSIRAQELHEQAHRLCFIANSVNFEVRVEPEMVLKKNV
jgi:organic hydroperoxide reductase OsmC/OhrA